MDWVIRIIPNRGHTTVEFYGGAVACSCGMIRNKIRLPNLRDPDDAIVLEFGFNRMNRGW
jgi:hypothetical protein